MKTTIAILAIVLASCGPITPGSPNPLDTPATQSLEPVANGHWGPHGTAPAAHRNFNGSP